MNLKYFQIELIYNAALDEFTSALNPIRVNEDVQFRSLTSIPNTSLKFLPFV
jgi:hypothetical protein